MKTTSKPKNEFFNKVSNLIGAGLMLFFAIPKLIGVKKRVKGFEQLKSLVCIDSNIFRIFTGFLELIIAILLIVFTINNTNSLGGIGLFLIAINNGWWLNNGIFLQDQNQK